MKIFSALCATAVLAVCVSVTLCATAAESTAALFPIRIDDRHGLIDRNGAEIVAPEFVEVTLGDPLILVKKGNRIAFFDMSGKLAIAPQSLITQPFSSGLSPVWQATGDKAAYGYQSPDGRMVVPSRFAYAEGFVDGLAIAGVKDEWGELRYGAINLEGTWTVRPAFKKKPPPIAGGVIRFFDETGAVQAFDREGKPITPKGADFIGIASEGLVRFWSGRKQGFMTVKGDIVVPPRFDGADDFKENMARVNVAGRYGFIDRTGRLAVAADWDTAEHFSEGLALVKQGARTAYIDKTGRTILEPQADRAYPFSDGLAVVKLGNRYGFIDRTGKVAIEPQYHFANGFRNGLAYVVGGPVTGYIRKDGSFVWKKP